MSTLIGKIFENVKTNKYLNSGIETLTSNKYVSSSLESLKSTSIVSNGLEVCNIAYEVYNTVQSDNKAQEAKAEEIYANAARKVTKLPNKSIKKRLDYKLVAKSAVTGRRVKKISKKTLKSVKTNFLKLKKEIKRLSTKLKTDILKISEYLKINFNRILSQSPEKLNTILESLKSFTSNFYSYNMELFTKLNDCIDVSTLLKKSQEKLNEFKAVLVDNSVKLSETMTKNKANLQEICKYNCKQLTNGFIQNWLIIKKLVALNQNLISEYCEKLDLELFYSPKHSVKPIASLKSYYSDIFSEKTEQPNLVNK